MLLFLVVLCCLLLAAAAWLLRRLRLRQLQYARVQLYEDADRPCELLPMEHTKLPTPKATPRLRSLSYGPLRIRQLHMLARLKASWLKVWQVKLVGQQRRSGQLLQGRPALETSLSLNQRSGRRHSLTWIRMM